MIIMSKLCCFVVSYIYFSKVKAELFLFLFCVAASFEYSSLKISHDRDCV